MVCGTTAAGSYYEPTAPYSRLQGMEWGPDNLNRAADEGQAVKIVRQTTRHELLILANSHFNSDFRLDCTKLIN